MSRRMALVVAMSVLAASMFIGGPVGARTTGTQQAVGSGAISGTVSDGTTGIGGVAVRAYDAPTGAFVAKTTTDAAGHYVLGALPVGGYKVLVNGTDQSWVIQWYGGSSTKAHALIVPVSAAASSTVDVVLQLGGIITGTFNSNFTLACAGNGIPVRVYDSTGRTLVAKTSSSSSVFYIGGVPPGSYLVRFGDGIACSIVWWNNGYFGAANRSLAQPVVVTAGGYLTNDTVLFPPTQLRGRATDGATGSGIGGLDVRVYDIAESIPTVPAGTLVAKTVTGSDGSYSVGPFHPGVLRVRFSDPTGRYALEWWQDQPSYDLASKINGDVSETEVVDPVLDLVGSP